jgi:hypothetical protein
MTDNMVMPVAPSGFGGFGGGADGIWLILIVLFALGGGGFGGFGANGNYDFPWILNGQQGINNNVSDGFRDQMLNGNLSQIQTGVSGLSNQICAGFAGVEQGANARQMANMQTDFAMQTAVNQGFNGVQSQLAQCCCDNRLATEGLKYTIAQENCADRQAISDGIRDILSATQAQTTAILNQMCTDKIEQKNDTIAQLRSELLYARGQASQDVQTSAIEAGQRYLANEIERYVAPRPIPAYIVANPNGGGTTT